MRFSSRLAGRLGTAMLCVLLAGCGGGGMGPSTETFRTGVGLPVETVRSWSVTAVNTVVPETLSVSQDPNVRFPNVDLVWWEDEPGDRRAQVAAILKNAGATAFSELQGTVPVTVTITLRRFHALTPAALASGSRAWHDISFDIVITDAAGAVLAEEQAIDSDVRAFQGAASDQALAQGETQKIRIARRIAQVMTDWLGLR